MPGHPPAAIRPWTTAKKGTPVPCNLPIVVTLAGVTVETFGPFIRNYIGTRRIKVIVIHISANVNTIRHISLFSSVMHKESCGLFVFFVNGRQFQKYPSRGGQHPPLIPDFRKPPDERIRPVGAANSRPQPDFRKYPVERIRLVGSTNMSTRHKHPEGALCAAGGFYPPLQKRGQTGHFRPSCKNLSVW